MHAPIFSGKTNQRGSAARIDSTFRRPPMKNFCRPVLWALLGIFAAAHCSYAQTYPTKVIRLIVPGPAGGGTDIIARIVAEGLTRQYGQTVVVDHRGGGAGMIGTDAGAKAAPD